MSYISILLLNLTLLGFQSHAILVDEQMFSRSRVNQRAFEIISHFLFNLIDSHRTHAYFEHCWPIQNQAASRRYMQLAYQWLNELRYKHDFLLRVSVRKSILQECYGQEIERIMMAFSTATLEMAVRQKTVILDTKQVHQHMDRITLLFDQLEKDRQNKKKQRSHPIRAVKDHQSRVLPAKRKHHEDTYDPITRHTDPLPKKLSHEPPSRMEFTYTSQPIEPFSISVRSIRHQVQQILSSSPDIDTTLYTLPHLSPTMESDTLYPIQSPSLHVEAGTPYRQSDTPNTHFSSSCSIFDDLESVASLRLERPPWRPLQESKMFDIDIYTPVR
ncbi:HAUS augmin-like complex subunit 6 N-terminus-domain-containing protein [Choanephora cucurbitarum]|nr:HAUS augmin-like complex subunit 6 N-terminus-domain-containing protein [Choanephora cucurbitarum]